MTDDEKKKVLIVDDEPDMRIFMSALYETSGYSPMTARNGKEGMEKVCANPPDLIVLDVMMPGEGGVTMYRQLKADAGLKDIPVLMLSGVPRKTFFHYVKMLNIRLDDPVFQPEAYVEKPPDPEEMLAISKRLLGV